MRGAGDAVARWGLILACGLPFWGLGAGCDAPEEVREEARTAEGVVQVEPEAPGEELARPDRHWVESRVEDAQERLHLEEVGERVWAMIEAHGGLMAYFEAGPLFYHEVRGDAVEERLVDTWSGRALSRTGADGEAQRWGGEEAEEEPPYFLAALPFLLSDPGVELEEGEGGEIKARFPWQGEEEHPYGIAVDEETGWLKRVRTAQGEELEVEELTEVGGVRLPAQIGEVTHREFRFRPQEPLSTFSLP